jgi:uncharacterized protein YjbI with pentapeptide repeats
MRRADLELAQMKDSVLTRAQMPEALLSGAQLQRSDLRWTLMDGASLEHAQLEGAQLWGAQMRRVSLFGAQLDGADLTGAFLDDARLVGAEMRGTNLSAVRLNGADIGGTAMSEANLWSAQLEGVSLAGAELLGANLSYSRLVGSADSPLVLEWTNLDAVRANGSALRFVDLRAAIFSPTSDFRNAFGDATVLLPIPGENRPYQWPRRELSDREFYARWRGWLALAPEAPSWASIAPDEWHDVEPVPPPPGCVWQD